MQRAITVDDLFRLHIITDVQISPDGQTIAYIVKRSDVEQNTTTTHLYLRSIHADLAADAVEVLCAGKNAQTPRWSSDSSLLAFTASRDGVRDIYCWNATRSEEAPRKITSLVESASEIAWSPDGQHIAFVATAGAATASHDEHVPGNPIRHITRRQYRMDGYGYLDDQFSHIWLVDRLNGRMVRLTSGDYDHVEPAWSPDGKTLAFTSNRVDAIHIDFSSQLYLIDVSYPIDHSQQGNRNIRCISAGTSIAAAPVWSPDGAKVAYIGRRSAASAGGNITLYIVSPETGAIQNSTAQFDRSVGSGVFSDTWNSTVAGTHFWFDHERIGFTACDQGRVNVYAATIAGDVQRILSGDRVIGLISYAPAAQRMAYAAGDCLSPCDVYISAATGSDEQRLTALNQQLLDDIQLQQPELLQVASYPPLATVDAWLIRPVGYTADKQYPLIHYIHGGPHSTFGYAFFFDMQLLAAQGWNVLYVNPRGSQGYGETHATCNIGAWGDGDWPEQEAAIDLAIRRGGVDLERIGVTGLSYGGYMVNWVIAHSHRYKAAISENGISNLATFYSTSDIGWFWIERELGRSFWNHVSEYIEQSPFYHAPAVSTPLLLLSAEQDYRCPIEQSEQFYTALQSQGVHCEMVRFPGESHFFLAVGKPASRKVRREHIVRWFTQHFTQDS